MKKLVLAVVISLVSLTACGGSADDPKSTYQAYINAVASGNNGAASKFFPSECRSEFLTGVVMAKAFGIDIREFAKEAAIENVVIDGDTAIVTVNDETNEMNLVNGKWLLSCDDVK